MSDLAKILRQHVIHNRVDRLRQALQGKDINMSVGEPTDGESKINRGTTLLMFAVIHKRAKIVKMLLGMNGLNIDAQDNSGMTALMLACELGHLNLVEKLLDAGANIDERDWNEVTPLTYAVRSGHVDVARTLLAAKGINADVVNQNEESRAEIRRLNSMDGDCPLTIQAAGSEQCTPELVRLLTNVACDFNEIAEDGRTPLFQALFNPRVEHVIPALVSGGADVNKPAGDGKIPLMIAAYNSFFHGMVALIKAGSDVHLKDNNGYTALHSAARGRRPDPFTIELLLAAGSDVNSRDNANQTPLMTALMNFKDKEIIRELLNGGADVFVVDNDGWTVLMRAVSQSTVDGDTLRLLLDAGCGDTINQKNNDGDSALYIAIRNGSTKAIPVLLGDVNGVEIDMRKCSEVAASADILNRRKANQCVREVAATVVQRQWREYSKRVDAARVIQRQWRECYYNPSYLVCQKRLMEEGEAMERDVERLRIG